MHFIFYRKCKEICNAFHFSWIILRNLQYISFLQLNLKKFAMECKFVGINGYICNGLHFWGYDRTKAIHITS